MAKERLIKAKLGDLHKGNCFYTFEKGTESIARKFIFEVLGKDDYGSVIVSRSSMYNPNLPEKELLFNPNKIVVKQLFVNNHSNKKGVTMKVSKKDLMNFAESLTNALEEVADKIGAIEDIINGDKEVNEVVEDDDYTDDDSEIIDDDNEEEPVVEDTEIEEEDSVEEPIEEDFSEKRYENVKNFLTM